MLLSWARKWAGLFLLLTFLGPRAARGALLILQSSDHHGEYTRIEAYLRKSLMLRENFLKKHPNGQIVHVFNGDIVGHNLWTRDDHGYLGYEMMAALSQIDSQGRDHIVATLGNHDFFDWLGARGNKQFIDQTRELRSDFRPGHTFRWNVANLRPTPAAADFITSHQDVVTPQGSLRFVGVVLDEFFEASRYAQFAEPRLFESVQLSLSSIQHEIRRAAADGVAKLVVVAHNSFRKIPPLREAIDEWKKSAGLKIDVEIPLYIAAHDHQHHNRRRGEAWFVDSGRSYDFTAIEMDDQFNVLSAQGFSWGALEQAPFLTGTLPSPLDSYLERVKLNEALLGLQYQEIVGRVRAVPEFKKDLRTSRVELGNNLSDALQAWGRRQVPATETKRVFAFFNSFTYRLRAGIPEGLVKREYIAGIYPLGGQVALYRVSGADMQKLFRSLRQYIIDLFSKGSYSPQMSSNLNEVEHLQLATTEDGGLQPDQTYYLALDPQLAENGYSLPDWHNILQPEKRIAEEDFHSVLEEDFVRQISDLDPCESHLVLHSFTELNSRLFQE